LWIYRSLFDVLSNCFRSDHSLTISEPLPCQPLLSLQSDCEGVLYGFPSACPSISPSMETFQSAATGRCVMSLDNRPDHVALSSDHDAPTPGALADDMSCPLKPAWIISPALYRHGPLRSGPPEKADKSIVPHALAVIHVFQCGCPPQVRVLAPHVR
jgi:hypothetical protein